MIVCYVSLEVNMKGDFHYTFHRNKSFDVKKEDEDKFMNENIYSFEGTIGEFSKKENRLHNWLKYKFIQPFVFIADKICGRYLVKTVPKKRQYRNIRIFKKSFEESVKQWNDLFLRNVQNGSDPEKFSLKGYLRKRHNRVLLKMMEIYITFTMNDTAYLEMHNILMFNITKNMSQVYGDKYNHLFYTSKSVNDVNYFYAIKHIDGVVVIKPAKEVAGYSYTYESDTTN